MDWRYFRPQSPDCLTAICDSGAGHGNPRGTPCRQRQVTLIQTEHLPIVAALCGKDSVQPDQLRRNILVSGINLIALKGMRFRIGEALLEGTGPCAPCSLMEENLGNGGYNAMRGHGGITAIVIEGGSISIGDTVVPLEVVSVEEE